MFFLLPLQKVVEPIIMKRFNNIFLVIITIFLLNSLCITAQTDSNKPLSAEQLLIKCEHARTKCQYEQLGKLSKQLMVAADGDKRYEAYSNFYQGLTLLFTGHGEASMKPLKKAGCIAKEIENDSIVALTLNAQGIYHAMYENNLFVAQNFFLRSLKTINKIGYDELRARVYGNLIILSHSKNDSTGLNHAKHIYDYGVKHKKYELQYLGTYYLALYNYLKENYNEAEKQLKLAINIFNKFSYDDVASVYTLYSEVKMKMGDINAAENMAKKAINLAKEYKQKTLLSDALLQYAEVLNSKGQYNKSNETAFEALELAKIQNKTKEVDCLKLIAKNYHSQGHKDEAINFMQAATTAMDTLSTVNMDRLMNERAIMQNIEIKEQESILQKQRIKSQRILNIVLASAVVLMLLLLWYILRLYHKRNALYKSIVIQNTNATKRESFLIERIRRGNERLQQAEQQLEELEQRRKPRIEDDKAQELYDRLCLMMERDRIYANSQIHRESVAEALGTNRTYLSQIIKEKGGMSYVQFINSYRINDAIRILSDSSQINYPLKQICSDLGFNSTATFYKLFQQAVGITPSVYRKQFLGLSANSETTDNNEEL